MRVLRSLAVANTRYETLEEAMGLLARRNENWPAYSVETCDRCGKPWDIWNIFSRLTKRHDKLLESLCPICAFWVLCDEYGMEAPPSSRKRYFQDQKIGRRSNSMVKDEHLGGQGSSARLAAKSVRKPFRAKLGAVEMVGTKFGEKFVAEFAPAIDGANSLWLNGTSLRLLVEAYGRNEKKWKGKSVLIRRDKIMGKACLIVAPGKSA